MKKENKFRIAKEFPEMGGVSGTYGKEATSIPASGVEI